MICCEPGASSPSATADRRKQLLLHILICVFAAMSAAIWPPIGDAQLAEEQAASQAKELEWLLVQLRETLQSLKAGLEECAALLAPSENGSTLVLSSVRSESLKGLITRIGTRITKGVCLELCTTRPILNDCIECQATHRKSSTTAWLSSLRPHHLLSPASTNARHPSAHLCEDIDQQLLGRYRCSHLGRRCNQGEFCRWTAAATARSHPGSKASSEGLLRRTTALVGASC